MWSIVPTSTSIPLDLENIRLQEAQYCGEESDRRLCKSRAGSHVNNIYSTGRGLHKLHSTKLQLKAPPFKAGMDRKAYKFSHFNYSLVMS